MTHDSERSVRALVIEHVDAFNAHDRPRLLAGLTPDVVWTTGSDVFHGVTTLADVFDDAFWTLQPSLTITELLVNGNRAAAQLLELLTVDGQQRRSMIACFFGTSTGRIHEVKVYREGTADVD